MILFYIFLLCNNSGQTALHKAVQQKHRNICYMLVAAGASLTMRDTNGQTPMMVAFQVEDNDLATYLESMYFKRLLFALKQYLASEIHLSFYNNKYDINTTYTIHYYTMILIHTIQMIYIQHVLCLILLF